MTISANTFAVPHPELIKLEEGTVPNAAYLPSLKKQVYTNASTVPSSLGGGLHGHLGIVMPVADYAALVPHAPAFVNGMLPNSPSVSCPKGSLTKHLIRIR